MKIKLGQQHIPRLVLQQVPGQADHPGKQSSLGSVVAAKVIPYLNESFLQ